MIRYATCIGLLLAIATVPLTPLRADEPQLATAGITGITPGPTMVVNIRADGTLVVAGRKVTLTELTEVVLKAKTRKPPYTFIVCADKTTRQADIAAVLKQLKAEGVKALVATAPDLRGAETTVTLPSADEYTYAATDTSLALKKGKTVIWKLNFDKKEGKPYIHPLCTSDGMLLTAMRPKDHPWHRALWFSWKHINGLNYWEENRKTGLSQGRTEITTIKILARQGKAATIDMTLSYHPPGNPALLTEKRTMVISLPDKNGVYTIKWTSASAAGDVDVHLDRTPIKGETGGKGWGGYAGLSLRLAPALKTWAVTDSEGRKDMQIHGKQARWMGFGSRTGGGGIFIEAGASTLGVPPWYLAKGMPYFSPAVLFAKPHTIKAGKSIEMAYTITIYPVKGPTQ